MKKMRNLIDRCKLFVVLSWVLLKFIVWVNEVKFIVELCFVIKQVVWIQNVDK